MEKVEYILQTDNISKSYGKVEALSDVSIRFSANRIYGLFGRNGAGKTTLLNIISSRIYADRGNVSFFGKDIEERPGEMAANCCYMPEKHYFPGRYTVKKLLSHAQKSFPCYDVLYAERLCRAFKLNTGQKYEHLSRGYQSVFRIVFGLASRSPITIFDEPVLGLDTAARDRFYSELIEEFSSHSRLFIISTHFIEESADIFNEAVILKNGRIIRQAPVDELLSNAYYVSGKSDKIDDFIKNRNVLSSQTVNDLKTVVVEGTVNPRERFPGLNFSPLTIQKLFIHLTKDSSEQEQQS